MNPEAAEFHPSVLALVPAPLVLAPLPIPVVARKQQRRRKKKKNPPDANARRPKPRAADAPARKSRNAKPPPPPEPVWPRAPPPPPGGGRPSPPPPAPLRVQIARPSDHGPARWRVAADAGARTETPPWPRTMRSRRCARRPSQRAGAAARAAPPSRGPARDDCRATTTCRRRRRTRPSRAPPPDTSAAALADHCAHNRVAALRLALRASRDAVNGRDRRGRTPLHAAAARGHTELRPGAAQRRCRRVSARPPAGDAAARVRSEFPRPCRRRVRARVVPRDDGQGAVRRRREIEARRPHGPALRRGARRQAGGVDVDRARARRGRRLAAGVRRARPVRAGGRGRRRAGYVGP